MLCHERTYFFHDRNVENMPPLDSNLVSNIQSIISNMIVWEIHNSARIIPCEALWRSMHQQWAFVRLWKTVHNKFLCLFEKYYSYKHNFDWIWFGDITFYKNYQLHFNAMVFNKKWLQLIIQRHEWHVAQHLILLFKFWNEKNIVWNNINIIQHTLLDLK